MMSSGTGRPDLFRPAAVLLMMLMMMLCSVIFFIIRRPPTSRQQVGHAAARFPHHLDRILIKTSRLRESGDALELAD